MPEITLTDLIAWEPRLRPVGIGGIADGSHAEAWSERELSWAVTVRATAPMLPASCHAPISWAPRDSSTGTMRQAPACLSVKCWP